MDKSSDSENVECFSLPTSNTEVIKSDNGNSKANIENTHSSNSCKEIPCSRMKKTDYSMPQDEELSAKILQRVEYLFSDENLRKDNFLLKHILKDNNGYVSLKLIASYRKIKALTKDCKVVALSLLPSRKLEMSSEMTKVRRLDPFPDNSSFPPFTKVLVFEMPPTVKTDEDVKNILKCYGTVVDVSVLSPENSTWSSFCTSSCKSMCASPYAVAEFETPEEAIRATKHISNANQPFVVSPFIKDSWRNSDKQMSPLHSLRKWRNSSRDSWWKLPSLEDSNSSDERLPSPTRIGKYGVARKTQRHRKDSSLNSEDNKQDRQRLSRGANEGTAVMNSIWKLKRQMAIKQEKNNVVIIREPRGPDGTIGFHAGRAKANLKTVVV